MLTPMLLRTVLVLMLVSVPELMLVRTLVLMLVSVPVVLVPVPVPPVRALAGIP